MKHVYFLETKRSAVGSFYGYT